MTRHSGQFTSDDPRRGRKPVGAIANRTKFLNGLKEASKTEKGFIAKILEMAHEGNTTCLNIAATRLWKESKQTLPVFTLPVGSTKKENSDSIIEAMLEGKIAPDAGVAAMTVLRAGAELTEVNEILERLKELESR